MKGVVRTITFAGEQFIRVDDYLELVSENEQMFRDLCYFAMKSHPRIHVDDMISRLEKEFGLQYNNGEDGCAE